MHAAIGGQRRLSAAHQGDKGLQLIGLRVINVVAGEQRQVIRTAAGRGQGVCAQPVYVRRQGKVRERFIRAVHVQERLPQRLLPAQLHPFAARRRGTVHDMHVADMHQAKQGLAAALRAVAAQVAAHDVVLQCGLCPCGHLR